MKCQSPFPGKEKKISSGFFLFVEFAHGMGRLTKLCVYFLSVVLAFRFSFTRSSCLSELIR